MFTPFPTSDAADGPRLPPFPFPFLFRFPAFGLNPPLLPNLPAVFRTQESSIAKQPLAVLADKRKTGQRPTKQIQVQFIDGSQEKRQINVTLKHNENVHALEKVLTEKCPFLSVLAVTAGDSTSSNVIFTGNEPVEVGEQLEIPISWYSLCNSSLFEEDSNVGDDGSVLKELSFGDEIVIFKKRPVPSVKSEAKSDAGESDSEPPPDSKDSESPCGDSKDANGFQCERCGKMFSYAYYRDKHLKYTRCVDNGDRKFPCPLCSRSFEKRDRLRIHVLHVHENHRPHGCTVCGKAFSQSSSLNKHLRVHSGERPYLCPFCSKSFTASSILRTHIRQHSGEKPFKCAFCGKSFASHAAHDSHVRRSHSDHNTANLLKCQFCDKCFDHESHLQFHKQCFHAAE